MSQLTTELVDESLVTNMYSKNNAENWMRAENLKNYLQYFITRIPKIILVGEAPGYRGCCVSGVPFTSTSIVRESDFFKNAGITNVQFIQSEATASIIWEYLDDRKVYPLFWNAYPFHPHNLNNPKSNRKPTKYEVEVGKRYIIGLSKIFPKVPIVAVGKVAHNTLLSMGIKADYIRHPSYGGKEGFIKGVSKYL